MHMTVMPVGRSAVRIIDQTLLPNVERFIEIDNADDAYEAIKRLQVRGAPAIGVFTSLILAVIANKIEKSDYKSFREEFFSISSYLNSSRPTAVNLSWACKEMETVVEKSIDVPKIKELLFERANEIMEEDVKASIAIGKFGQKLIKDGYGILTHCNAGMLATVEYGTATAPIYMAKESGISGLRIYCDETRPLLQGARLTSYELAREGLDVTVLCDNMANSLMREKKVDIIFVGADRIAQNGDVANKIGTASLAVNAAYYKIPFYVCAPSSTFDKNCKSGTDIEIEYRDEFEITTLWYNEPMVPKGVKAYNPAFDITDHSLITGIISESGIWNLDRGI